MEFVYIYMDIIKSYLIGDLYIRLLVPIQFTRATLNLIIHCTDYSNNVLLKPFPFSCPLR
jgi:hypothetical protein